MIVVWSCSPELSGHNLFVPMSLLFMNGESGQVLLLFWKVWQGWLSSGYLRNAFCQALSKAKVHLCEGAPELVCYEEEGTIWVFPSVLVHLSSCNKISQTGELINKQKYIFFNSGAWKFKIKVPEMSPFSSHRLLLVFSQGRRHKCLSQPSFMRALTPFRRVPPSSSNQLLTPYHLHLPITLHWK